jgi:hypothetical protein
MEEFKVRPCEEGMDDSGRRIPFAESDKSA